jgi:multidrug resistance protein, MATE family
MATHSASPDLRLQTSNRQILRIALPISMALLVPQINFVINNVFVSGLGETGLNSGLQGLLARRAGENRPDEIGRLFIQGLWIAGFFSAAAILITYLAGPWILYNSIHSEEVYRNAIGFLKIRVWGVPFLYFFQMCNALLVGTNNSRYMKVGFGVQAAVNVVFDYCLIYGHWGLPALGFNGAAVASIFAEISGLLVVLLIIFYKNFGQQFSLFRHLRFNASTSGLIFRQSSPLVAQYLLSIMAWVMFYIFIEHKGKRPLAISNAMRNIFRHLRHFCLGFCQHGQCHGE